MKDLWKHHFKYYDLFQNNFRRYRETIETHLNKLKNYHKILDTGAGSGNLTLELLKQGHKVVAIDSNKYALEILENKCKKFKNEVEVMRMDVQKIDLEDNSFDGVSSMFLIPFVEDNKKYISEVYRILRAEGRFSISAWSPVKDSLHGLLDLQKHELEEKRILPKHQREWEYVLKSAKVAVNQVLNGISESEFIKILEKTGFKNFKKIKHDYGKYAWFLTCEK
jgi:ubiquinone/menaquinone biosynthesis C-methylase UbiE